MISYLLNDSLIRYLKIHPTKPLCLVLSWPNQVEILILEVASDGIIEHFTFIFTFNFDTYKELLVSTLLSISKIKTSKEHYPFFWSSSWIISFVYFIRSYKF